jgi:hypothetical protein
MSKKERIAPIALMFVAAGLSFLVCEQISKQAPSQDTIALAFAQTNSPAVAQATPPENFAQKIVRKITHAVHSTAHSAELMETAVVRESGLQELQPETAEANELGDVTLTHGPLDLSLVPAVILLPKKQEPLASAGLYDKRTHQKIN